MGGHAGRVVALSAGQAMARHHHTPTTSTRHVITVSRSLPAAFAKLPHQSVMSSAGGGKRQPGPHGTMRQAQENLIIMPEEDSRDVSPVQSGGADSMAQGRRVLALYDLSMR